MYRQLELSLLPFNLCQIVTTATHNNPSGSDSLIDLVYVSKSSFLSSCDIIAPLANSDHNSLIICLQKSNFTPEVSSSERIVWNYAKADFCKVRYLINSTNWKSMLNEDVNVLLANWQAAFLNIMDS